MKERSQKLPMSSKVSNPVIIPIFFACDERFVMYTCVALQSLIANASKAYRYHVHVLCTDISEQQRQKLHRLATEQVEVFCDDVSGEIEHFKNRLHIRDDYSITTYYRLFIPHKFPQYDKALYLDSDIIVLKDISELYLTELGGYGVGAVQDAVMMQTDIFGTYVEKVLGIDRNYYFNAGVLLLDCADFRKHGMFNRFVELLNAYTFVVAQDQDYLNVLYRDRVYWLDPRWNAEASRRLLCEEKDIAIVHYNLADKPWHYRETYLADYFWQYARETEDYGTLLCGLEQYSQEEKQRDLQAGEKLSRLVVSETEKADNGRRPPRNHTLHPDLRQSLVSLAQSKRHRERQAVLDKIFRWEREGRFDEDVEEDPPTVELLPQSIDYLHKTWRERMCTRQAFGMARWFMNYLVYKKQLVVKEIRGIEHLQKLGSGAVITCNHFHPLDSFVMHMVHRESKQTDRRLYCVIREGNYTNFPGFYGYLMRNCNTLPLSSNYRTMTKFLTAVDTLLRGGDFVLVYPEQSMWWNYRKPKPLKSGAYKFAAKSGVPVVPCFITMRDTELLDGNGFPVQEYTVHVSAPICPDAGKTVAENAELMRMENFEVWKRIYEETYRVPLRYSCDQAEDG